MKIEEISNFAYDGLDRLVSEVESSGVSRTYAYDLAGNRLAKTETGSGAIAYALGIGDRLATYTGGSYSYDTAGCVTAIDRTGKPDLDLTWNGQYQLTSVSTNGIVAESYTYDPFGRRFSTTSGGTTLRHVYDGIHCVADIDSVGRVVKSYTWGPGIDNLLAVTCHSGTLATTYYALTDLQGTVHGFADAGGNLVARYAYDAWGNLLDADVAVSELADNRYLFQGREYSWATGLTNFRLRWYDPATGRWLSKDPIGISGGLNLYAFCGDDPVNYVDPLGLRVVNNSEFPIWVKPENNDDPKYSATGSYPVKPGATWDKPQDGISVPYSKPNSVYKSVTGVDLTVNSDGSISWSGGGIKGNAGMISIGGWQGRDWLSSLHGRSPSDKGWDNLFRDAKSRPGGDPSKKHPRGEGCK